MTNQEAFESARAGDWIAESFSRTGDVFKLKGKASGYSSFADCLTDGQSIFYAAFDENDNREAGLAVWDAGARTLTPVEIHATLRNGAFIKGDPDPVPFGDGGTITGTFNATAFNAMWSHVWEKGNPHETQAHEIDQNNDKLGDNVQEALDKIAAYVIQLDPDGNTDIDWGDLDGLKDLLDSKAEQVDLEQEIQDRIDGDKALQDQIDALDPDGDRKVDWSEIEGKPAEFPPAAHDQGWDTITDKPADYPPSAHGHAWDEITGKPTEFPPEAHDQGWDTITGKPATYPPEDHTHEQGDIDGLELRLEAIENSITDGGGFVDAPDDGKLYGRQSEAWAEVVIPDAGASSWNDLTDKPTEFPPEAHQHGWDEIADKPTEFPPSAHDHAWDQITGKPTEFPPSAHNHAWDQITEKPTEFPPASHGHEEITKDAAYIKYVVDKWEVSPDLNVTGTASAESLLSTPIGYLPDQDGAYLTVSSTSYDGSADGDWGKGGYKHKIKTDNGGTSRITVDYKTDEVYSLDSFGNASFSGSVSANNIKGQGDRAGFLFDGNKKIIPTEDGSASNGKQDLGSTANKFKDGWFDGHIYVNQAELGVGSYLSAGGVVLKNNTGESGIIITNNGTQVSPIKHEEIDLGDVTRKWKDAYFSGTVDAAAITVNGAPISGGGLPDGGYTYGWSITATDFIATSDERLKDNITPMPVGLIDDIKPVQWDWKDGSGKSAGVVAQQLQAIGLDDYVVEGDDSQLGVNYQALTAILLAEVISLKAEVEALKS